MIRCYQCKHFKPIGKKGLSGWCKDNREGRKSIRVRAVDHCDYVEAKEE